MRCIHLLFAADEGAEGCSGGVEGNGNKGRGGPDEGGGGNECRFHGYDLDDKGVCMIVIFNYISSIRLSIYLSSKFRCYCKA